MTWLRLTDREGGPVGQLLPLKDDISVAELQLIARCLFVKDPSTPSVIFERDHGTIEFMRPEGHWLEAVAS